MTHHAIFAAALLALPLPALAAEKFTPPKGCTSELTVQSLDCVVTLIWRCEAEPEGAFWSASFGPGGLESLVGYDPDYQWREANYTWDQSREVFTPPATAPISVSTLLAEGRNAFDFNMDRTEGGETWPVQFTGTDELTGDVELIDGYVLDKVATRLDIHEEGEVVYSSTGTQYFSRELGHFFLGPEVVTEADGSQIPYDGSPVDIIAPGEPGFGATVPLYNCTELSASLIWGGRG